jgi:hypothetical protein
MVGPLLPSRVKERNELPGLDINLELARFLPERTGNASQGEIS